MAPVASSVPMQDKDNYSDFVEELSAGGNCSFGDAKEENTKNEDNYFTFLQPQSC